MIILFLGFVEFRLFFFFLKNVTLENAALFLLAAWHFLFLRYFG